MRSTLAWALVSFVALQVALIGIMEYWCVHLRDPVYGPKLQRLQERAHTTPKTPLVVMLGSSHVTDILDGHCIEEALARATGHKAMVFNFGDPGATGQHEYLTLRRLLADGVRPNLVLLEVLLPSLDHRNGGDNLWIPSERLGLRDILMLQHDPQPSAVLRRAWYAEALFPWHARRFILLSMLQPKLLPQSLRQDWACACDDSGWAVRYPDYLDPATRARAWARAQEDWAATLSSFRLGTGNSQALRQALETCREHRVPAALVILPESSAFRNLYSAEAIDQPRAFLRRLQDEFHVPVVDAHEWLADEDFVDGHHAVTRGAQNFSRRLGRDVLPQLLERGSVSGTPR